MLNPSVTNPSISDVFQQIKRGELILQPSFQRRFVWTLEHQEAFIETILKKLPFPEIYVCTGKTDVDKLTTKKDVIDGQQRLTTIYNYIEGNYENNKYFKSIPQFKDLNDQQKEDFIEYKVVFRDLGKINPEQTKEIFRRINMTEFKLDNIEIQNAIYDGEFIQTAKNILDQIDLESYGVLKESEFTRMADLHYILLAMSTLEHGGYYSNNTELEYYISNYNESYPHKEKMEAVFLKTFNLLKKLELAPDSLWFRKSSFFTLIVEIAKLFWHSPEMELFSEKAIGAWKSKLSLFSDNVLGNKNDIDSEYYQYYINTYQGTNNRSARVIRSDFFKKYCSPLIENPAPIDQAHY